MSNNGEGISTNGSCNGNNSDHTQFISSSTASSNSKRVVHIKSYAYILVCIVLVSLLYTQRYAFTLNLHQYTSTIDYVTKATTTTNVQHQSSTATTSSQQHEQSNYDDTSASHSDSSSSRSGSTSYSNSDVQRQEETTSSSTTTSINKEDELSSKSTQQQEEQAEGQQGDEPLNIVLFYADDWTFHTLGAMGNKYVYTPHLDELAQKDGILFTHNCVVASVCMQSRATLYTGQYSSVHQTFYSWADIKMYNEGKWNETLYPLMLNNNYHVGFFGKYHHLEPPPLPSFSVFHSNSMAHIVNCHGQKKHITKCNEQDGINFLNDRPKDQPFFLTLSFFATHAQDGSDINYQPQDETSSLYAEDDIIPVPKTHTMEHWKALPPFFNDYNVGRARFRNRYDTPENYQHNMKTMYRMANEVDTTCGKIIQLLKEQNVYDNTVIIFTTDNGNFHGEHGLSEKWYAYEESLRVPLIIKDPRMVPSLRGTKNDEFTLNIDLAPTILSAAKVPVPSVMQGQDMAIMYTNNENDAKMAKENWRKQFLYEFWDSNDSIPNSVALVGQGFKYIYWTDHNYTQYFNLIDDPYEEYDIFTSADKTTLLNAQTKLDELQRLVHSGIPQ